MNSELDRESMRRQVHDTIRAADFRRATFGGAVRGGARSPWVRVVVRPVEVRGRRHLQFSYFDERKNVTKNYRGHEIVARLDEILAIGYAGIYLATSGEEVDIRTTKKGKVIVGRRKVETIAPETPLAHNRAKNVPLPEGSANRVLAALGILTGDGRVRPSLRAKYTQINEILKLLAHVLEDAELRSLGREVEILDCGCGSSYLTLAVHHYLKDMLGIPARVLGVDVNDEVIRKCVERSVRLGAGGIQFTCDRISAVNAKPDIVLALHACDTATDDALALAVAAEAKIVLSVPCCHHDLNDQIRAHGPAQVLRPLLRHGILRQHTADLVTDAFRALALRIMGYQTDVIEFISPEHTARNLMIRAVRGAPFGEPVLVKEYLEMRRFWGVEPHIERALGEPFRVVCGLAVPDLQAASGKSKSHGAPG
jgi:hypothetical protein